MELGEDIRSFLQGSNMVCVGTADHSGKVHLSVTKEMRILDEKHVVFEEWFCERTLENLKENFQISVGVVDPKTGKGYQLMGEVEDVDLGAMLDGFARDKEEGWRGYPQSQHQLHVRVDSVMELNTGPHSDEAL